MTLDKGCLPLSLPLCLTGEGAGSAAGLGAIRAQEQPHVQIDACWGLQVAAPAFVGGKPKATGKKPSLYLHFWLVQLLGGSSVTLCFPEGSKALWKNSSWGMQRVTMQRDRDPGQKGYGVFYRTGPEPAG